MPPPPPPPPPAPPPNALLSKPPASNVGRAALLADIQHGTKLKKTETNDRSAPMVGGKVSNSGGGSLSNNKPAIKPESNGKSSSGPPVGGLGGLFANGVPKKPSEARNLQSKTAVNSTSTPINTMKPVPAKPFSSSTSTTSNSIISTVPTTPNLPKATPSKLTPKLPSTDSPSAAPLPPPKLKPTLPSQTSAPNLKKASHSSIDTPQSPPFNTLRSAHNAVSSESLSLRKTDNGERAIKPATNLNRPGAPPPPPPLNQPPAAPSAQLKPNGMVNKQSQIPAKSSPLKETSNANKTLPIRPAPPLPKQASSVQIISRDAPPPPPRVSSYIDSNDHRFHFLPVHDLPPPEAFVGFRKEYQNSRRTGPNMSSAY